MLAVSWLNLAADARFEQSHNSPEFERGLLGDGRTGRAVSAYRSMLTDPGETYKNIRCHPGNPGLSHLRR